MAGMFVVEPKRDCPHYTSEHLLPPHHWRITLDSAHPGQPLTQPVEYDLPNAHCSTCSDTSENWICLKCKNIACSRYVSGHSNEHFQATGHSLCLSFSDLTTWCNLCESYVLHPKGVPAHRALYFNKFNALSPSEMEASNTEAPTLSSPSVAATVGTSAGAELPSLVTLRQALESVPHSQYVEVEGCEAVDCAICQETVQSGETVTTTPCSHQFHRTCLLTWLLRTNECPTCRTKVLDAWARSPLVEH